MSNSSHECKNSHQSLQAGVHEKQFLGRYGREEDAGAESLDVAPLLFLCHLRGYLPPWVYPTCIPTRISEALRQRRNREAKRRRVEWLERVVEREKCEPARTDFACAVQGGVSPGASRA